MITVKNNFNTHLGFGSESILPGETKPLPRGYSETHPLVKFYVSQKWLEVVSGGKTDFEPAPEKPVDVKVNNGGGENGGAGGEKKENDGAGDNGAVNGTGENGNGNGGGENGGAQPKQLSRMNKYELLALCKELNVEAAEGDTNATLVEKIKAAQKVEE